MKKYILMIVICLSLALNSNVWALPITGSINNEEGLFATDGWNDGVGAALRWSITDNLESLSGHYEYIYTFAVDEKAISHMIIEVSINFTAPTKREAIFSFLLNGFR